MKNVKLLDCTLRDGGYINNWNFKKEAIEDILFSLSNTNVDIIECGFLTDREYDPDYTLYHRAEDVSNVLTKKNGNLYVAMIAIGEKEINPALLSPASKSPLDGIRLTFHQYEIDKAFSYGEIIMKKGYKLFMQPVGSTDYSDMQMIELIERVNKLSPYAFYIVDTLGMMYKKDIVRQFSLINHNLKPGIRLGYHSHNNLQLAFANAQDLIGANTDRELILDCSAYGMGRGAGNLCSELLMDYVNKYDGYQYDVLPLLEIIDQYLMPIYMSAPWGYSSAYYLAAASSCHPNYASYLLTKHSINMRTIASILDQIPQDSRKYFNKELIELLYQKYQNNAVDDLQTINELRKCLNDREVLIVASGQSYSTKKTSILNYIEKKNPFIIAINFIPKEFDVDLIFIGNNKRYEENSNHLDFSKVVLTSNIKDTPEGAKVVNYSDLINTSVEASDNSGIMLLKLLLKLSVKRAALAGFDGFDKNHAYNYYQKSFSGLYDPLVLEERHNAINDQLNRCAESLQLRFITPTKYKIRRNTVKG